MGQRHIDPAAMALDCGDHHLLLHPLPALHKLAKEREVIAAEAEEGEKSGARTKGGARAEADGCA